MEAPVKYGEFPEFYIVPGRFVFLNVCFIIIPSEL